MDTLLQSLIEGHAVSVEEIADQFVSALTEDGHKLESGHSEDISDCAMFAPNLDTQVDKRFGIAHLIATKCFALLGKKDEDNHSADMHYKRLTRNLRNTIRGRRGTLAAEGATKTKTSKSRPPISETVYAEHISSKKKIPESHPPHKDAPVSKTVLEPKAMPVEIPPLEDFEPFFNFLEQNRPFAPDDGKPYPFTPRTRILKFQRGAVYSDRRMDLCKQVVGPPHITRLMISLRRNRQIVHFLLGNNIIGIVGAQAIADYILDAQASKMKTWYLAGNDMDEEGMALIARALETDSSCQSLWLKRNPIKQGARHLAHALTLNHTIKVLDLQNTAILDDGAQVLFSALSFNHGLRFLYLDANGLTGKTADHIVKYITKLESRKGVTSMYLTMNRFQDDLIPAFRVLGAYKHLKRLNVGSGRLGPASAQSIYEAFAHHARLKVLDVGMYKATYDMGELPNSMGDEGAKWLAKLITENKCLREVTVNGNSITNAGFALLAQALSQNETVLFLGRSILDHERDLPIGKDISADISRSLGRNLRAQYGESIDLSSSSSELAVLKRQLRHGKHILDIDSVYRNHSRP